MEYIPVNLHDKRFRSKASSASRLSPSNLALSNLEGFIFLRGHYCDTVSLAGGNKREGDGEGKTLKGLR